MTVGDVRDYLSEHLSEHISASKWGVGGLYSTEEEQIILFGAKAYTHPIGVGQPSTYKGKGIKILVQWNKHAIESEQKAQEVYDFLFSCPETKIADKEIISWILRDPEPVYMGMNARGFHEFVIDLEMITER